MRKPHDVVKMMVRALYYVAGATYSNFHERKRNEIEFGIASIGRVRIRLRLEPFERFGRRKNDRNMIINISLEALESFIIVVNLQVSISYVVSF